MTLALQACVEFHAVNCMPGGGPAMKDTLYFGTGIPGGGVVGAEHWSEFLAATVTPKFPDGLTVLQAAGQWRGDDGAVVQETSYVLELLHPGDAASEEHITTIIAAYKYQFRQESVLRVREKTCVAF